ncbi:MAG: hypothetical protein ACLRYB_17150 [Segatella copri]
MAKKELKNSMMRQDMKAMLRGEAGISEPTTPSSVQTEMAKDTPRKKTESKEYERFNFVCSTELAAKAKSDFTQGWIHNTCAHGESYDRLF